MSKTATKTIERRLLSIKELAEYLGVSPGSLYNLKWAGKDFPIRPIEIPGRAKVRPTLKFDKKAVDAWIDGHAERR